MGLGEIIDKRIGEHIAVKTGLVEYATVTDVRPRQNIDGVVVVDTYGVIDGTNHEVHELVAPDTTLLYAGDRVAVLPMRGKDEYSIIHRVTHDSRQVNTGDKSGNEEQWQYSRLTRVWRALFGGKRRVRYDMLQGVLTLNSADGQRTVHVDGEQVAMMQGNRLAMHIDLASGRVYVNGDLHVNGTVYSNDGVHGAGAVPGLPAEPVDSNPPIESEPL